jgi:hypothetical protein
VAREPGDKLCLNGQKSTEAAEFDPKIASEQGRLAVRSGDRWLAMPLERTRFDTLVVGTIAETTVTQKFHNPFDQPIEALYTFPLAADGAVDGYAITVGSRTIRGEMKARAEAQKLYEEAKNDGRTAALLEQERANIFTQSLANIAPGESIEVTLHVVQPLRQERGTFELALPTVVGPRYAPADRVARRQEDQPAPDPRWFRTLRGPRAQRRHRGRHADPRDLGQVPHHRRRAAGGRRPHRARPRRRALKPRLRAHLGPRRP